MGESSVAAKSAPPAGLGQSKRSFDFGELHVQLRRLARDGATLNTQHALKSCFRSFAIAFLVRWGFTLVRVFVTFGRSRPREFLRALASNNIEKVIHDPAFQQGTASAVRFGQFFGGFTGLFHLARRFLRKTKLLDTEEAISFCSGAAGGLAIVFLNPSDWRVLALYMFARLSSCCWNSARQRGWLKPIERIESQFGALSVFALSSAQIMYCYVMRPDLLGAFFNFPLQAGPVSKTALECVRCTHRGTEVPWEQLQQQQLTPNCVTAWGADRAVCNAIMGNSHNIEFPREMPVTSLAVAVSTFRKGFNMALPMYAGLQVPFLVFRFKRFVRAPLSTLGHWVFSSMRSACFLAAFPTIFVSAILQWGRVFSSKDKSQHWFAGILASLSLLIEDPARRAELALFTLPRGADAYWRTVQARGWSLALIPGRLGEVALFCFSMAGLSYFYHHERSTCAPLFKTIYGYFVKEEITFAESSTQHTDTDGFDTDSDDLESSPQASP